MSDSEPLAGDSETPGVDLNIAGQLALLEVFKQLHDEAPFSPNPDAGWRYLPQNHWFPFADALVLHLMIRHLRPRRIVEVGSGFSSAVMLDTNERFLENAIDCTFVDPDPTRLLDRMRPEDRDRVTVISALVENVPLAIFESLGAHDIVFIDSSHVSLPGGDVNHLFFDVLPRLQEGVHVHVHDIFYGFEYPQAWIERNLRLSEAYLLRAFLQYNQAFGVQFFTEYLMRAHRDAVARTLPALLEATSSGSFWMRHGPEPA